MRPLLLAALVAAVPATAQTDRDAEVEREVVIETDDENVIVLDDGDGDREVRVRIRREGPGGDVVIEREGDHEAIRRYLRTVDPDGDPHEIRFDADVSLEPFRGPMMRFERMLGADGDAPFGVLRRMFGGADASPETRERMRALDRRVAELAAQARDADGAERDRIERELTAALGDLFDVRTTAREERADALRERAAELEAQAADLDAATAELLGAPTVDF